MSSMNIGSRAFFDRGATLFVLLGVFVVSAYAAGTQFDFDGDGKADIAVSRTVNRHWRILESLSGETRVTSPMDFALGTPIAADYDGDGKADQSYWYDSKYFFFRYSTDPNFLRFVQFGSVGDDPTITGDWNGDGKDDFAAYRGGSTGGENSIFYYRLNPPSFPPNTGAIYWGLNGDRPMRGDFDGDRKLDATVFRPSTGFWYTLRSLDNTFTFAQFGVASDRTVPGDYDGDGKSDIAVFRPEDGVWYTRNSSNGEMVATQFGISSDKPVPADYDGDGRTDIAVFRPSEQNWFLLRSSLGLHVERFGSAADIPLANVFVH